jgi:hypothetical protein
MRVEECGNQVRMFALRFICVIAALVLAMHAALAATIQIRVLNAKTGQPVVHQKVSVQVKGVRDATEYTTDGEGNINAEFDPAAQIFVATEWWRTCRKVGKDIDPYVSVSRIVQQGVVVENSCGRATTEVIRGRLIIFARRDSLVHLFEK